MVNKIFHSHSLIWIILIGCFVLDILLLFFLCMNGHINFKDATISPDSFICIISTFIGICTALMLGAQIYSVYSRTQTERYYDIKLNEVTDWLIKSTADYEDKLKHINDSVHNFEKIKHSVNDALAGIHYNERKLLKGIINVLDNIIILTNNQDLFGDEVWEKTDFAIYAISKNLKEYKDDEIIKKADMKGYIYFSKEWKTKFKLINFSTESGKHIKERIEKLNIIINKLTDNILAFNFKVGIEKEHLAFLNENAHD